MTLSYTTKAFSALSLDELYEILALRQEVFIVEQNCPYLDADGKDQPALHLLGKNSEGKLLAYTRILDKGISYDNYASIGRVITSQLARGKGLGYPLMEHSIEACLKYFPDTQIKISAQAHLKSYYGKLGFKHTGDAYLEDNIPHISMIYDKSSF